MLLDYSVFFTNEELIMLVICGSCNKSYSEYASACRHCNKTLQQQIDDNNIKIREIHAEIRGYERGVNDGVRIGLAQRVYNFFFFWL